MKKERICRNCIFWGKEDMYPNLDKKVLIPNFHRYLKVRMCYWKSHPSVRIEENYYTDEDYGCNEFKESES